MKFSDTHSSGVVSSSEYLPLTRSTGLWDTEGVRPSVYGVRSLPFPIHLILMLLLGLYGVQVNVDVMLGGSCITIAPGAALEDCPTCCAVIMGDGVDPMDRITVLFVRVLRVLCTITSHSLLFVHRMMQVVALSCALRL